MYKVGTVDEFNPAGDISHDPPDVAFTLKLRVGFVYKFLQTHGARFHIDVEPERGMFELPESQYFNKIDSGILDEESFNNTFVTQS